MNAGAPYSDRETAGARVLAMQTKLHRWATADPGRCFDDLFNLVHDPAFLVTAWHRVRGNKGGRAAGVDGIAPSSIDSPEVFLTELGALLKARCYRPTRVREKSIPKAGGKVRRLGIPTVADRVVQASLVLVLEPIFEADFLPCSYGFRPRRRAQDAISEIRYLATPTRNYQWVFEADIKACFDNIEHTALMRRVARRIEDRRVLALVRAFLRAGVLAEDGKARETITGTPQGGILSPLLANIALSVLDEHFTQKWEALGPSWRRAKLRRTGVPAMRLVRYADDCVPRRRTGGRKPSVQPCCTRDEGGPLGAAVQAEAPNHPLLLPSREVVVSELGKGGAGPCQVRTVESNVSEPLRTCRKRRDDVKTGGESLLRDQSGGHLSTAQMASGMKAARTWSRLLCGTWEPVTPMPRERCKGKPPECLSTDAGYRGGATRSSEEGPVMGLERRGCPIQLETREQLVTGGLF